MCQRMGSRLWFLSLLSCSSFVLSSRILVLSPLGPRSHIHSFMPIVETLAEKGHQITTVTAHSPKTNSPNIQKIVLKELVDIVEAEWYDFKAHGSFDAISAIQVFLSTESLAYDIFFANEKIQRIKQEKNFDIIILDGICNDFIFPLIEHLEVPFITADPGCGTPWNLAAQDISQDYATIPLQFSGFEPPMSFIQRVANVIFTETILIFRRYYLLAALDKLAKKDFPNASPISQIERKADLLFANIHPATCPLRSLPPKLIPLGAMHVRPAKPLPQDLQDFADGAEHGLIVFTLGSNSRVSSMPIHIQQTFHRVFSRLQQRVVWKWETGNFEPLPNVKMVDWLPQQDLLGHKNTQLFITHGGLMGIQEAIYHSVPILGLPLGRDQRGLLIRESQEGFAIKLEWEELTEETLHASILRILHDASFKNNATRLSRTMHDQLLPSKDVAAYWVEYVLRQGGTKHLEKPKDMPFYQLYLLDVLFFIALSSALLFYMVLKLACLCCYRRTKISKNKKKEYLWSEFLYKKKLN